MKRVKDRLLAAMTQKQVDSVLIIDQARQHGLLDHEVRKQVWPYLLGLSQTSAHHVEGEGTPCDEATRKVVDVDVERSMHSYDVTKDYDADKRESMRATLKSLIHKSLDLSVDPLTAEDKKAKLHYYQGYHDVVSVFQIVLGARLGEMYVVMQWTHPCHNYCGR